MQNACAYVCARVGSERLLLHCYERRFTTAPVRRFVAKFVEKNCKAARPAPQRDYVQATAADLSLAAYSLVNMYFGYLRTPEIVTLRCRLALHFYHGGACFAARAIYVTNGCGNGAHFKATTIFTSRRSRPHPILILQHGYMYIYIASPFSYTCAKILPACESLNRRTKKRAQSTHT